MCGIIGLVSSRASADRGWLAAGGEALRHRGPDDGGEWWSDDGRVGFGHRRLSIIDLSPAGHQPMLDREGRSAIVFNGEIYNFLELRRQLEDKGHVFRSHSDTEVLLAAYREWGTDCLARLNGMFAFALYDLERKRLFMARDRAGEKPLFYCLHGHSLRFASELKGLLADPTLPRRIDPEALDLFLTIGYVPGDKCILQGMHKLPAAHALVYEPDRDNLRTWAYWSLPSPPKDGAGGAAEGALLDQLEALLQDAVAKQLVADVPVGILLSGGVDSSLVTALAVRGTPRVKTFTVRVPGFAEHDETAHARLIARHFGTEHFELDAAEATPELLPLLARHCDEPIIDSSLIPTYLVSRLIRQHCTVALGGDGGDELFGGYKSYDQLLRTAQYSGRLPLGLRRMAAMAAQRLLPVGLRGRNRLMMLGEDMRCGLPLAANHFDLDVRRRVLAGRNWWKPIAETWRQGHLPNTGDLLQRATRMDFHYYLPEDILVKVDRASMTNSLEVRAPLLDFRVIEFAFGRVPTRLKATPSTRKVLLRMLCQRLLPKEFDHQRKQGFAIPLRAWLRAGMWKNYFKEVLLDPGSGFFARDAVAALLRGQDAGRFNSERLFGLVMFELWRREYRVQDPA